MNTVIEQVARALCIDRTPDDTLGGPHPHGGWLDEGMPWWHGYERAASMSVDALRNTLPEMVEAGMRALADSAVDQVGIIRAWQAMLDAAVPQK